jgi:hypothetical protein
MNIQTLDQQQLKTSMKMIKVVTTKEVKIRPITDMITKKEHIQLKMDKFTTDIMTNKVIGSILVTNNMIKVSIKGIGMRIINGLIQVVQVVKIMITITREMIKNLTII